jgi:formylglycine-generating enzyme required for sulfatase activity
VYLVNGAVYKTGQAVPVVSSSANGYRLPTEPEWEFAARGGTQSKKYIYSGSNDPAEVGWFYDLENYGFHPVGTKKANELGLYDMSGNVSEWCFSAWDAAGTTRVIRGGGISGSADDGAVAYRNDWGDPPEDSWDGPHGFRVALTPVP